MLGRMESRAQQVILEAADRHHGVVSRRGLLASGVPAEAIGHRLQSGLLVPVFPGVYSAVRTEITMDALRVAAVLASGEGGVLGARSAATAWGFLDHMSPIDVYRVAGGGRHRCRVRLSGYSGRPYLIVHRPRRLPPEDVIDHRGVPVTTVARTLKDLAALLPRKRFRRSFLEADRLGLLDDTDLVRVVARTRGHRGAGLMKRMVGARIPDIGRAHSVLEAIYLDLHQQGLVPVAEVNEEVLGREADLVWRRESVVVELDGYEFHRGREAFERDAARGNQLRAAGWTLLRFTWRMLIQDPSEVSAQIEAVLKQSRTN